MNLRRWLQEHSLKLLAIRDTPQAIAGGVAIGIFFAFTPFFGLKEVLTILFAWLTRSNIIAAVLAVTAHNIILPLMPVIYRWQYDVGYWLLSQPHHLPPPLLKAHWEAHKWRSWMTVFAIGKDLLVGSIACTMPLALFSYFATRSIVARHQRKKQSQAQPPTQDGALPPPSSA
jgi:uncharacterized protein (DUF2062 family)